jgi:AcrR family transcriptional regulator
MGTTASQRERQRAERHRLIVDTARELAETSGWDAVTTRRLAERIEYSQPVLYSHFSGKDSIVRAVALQGSEELAPLMRERVAAEPSALTATAAAYVEFASRHPALHDAMFQLTTEYPFADEASPPALHEGFGLLRDALAAATGPDDIDLRTELFWSALHGLVTLTRSGRLPAEAHEERLALLVAQLSAGQGGGSCR